MDISKLSSSDIESLRAALGIQNISQNVTISDDSQVCAEEEQFCNDNELRSLPNIRVHLDANDISDDDNVHRRQGISSVFGEALFGDSLVASSSGLQDNDEWELPML